jgi:uncharacterized protein (TIGR04562 family)
MHTIIGGRSAIDMGHLRLGQRGRDGAYRFLQRYGYDLENPVHAEDVERIRVEGLGFLRGVMLPGLPDDVGVPDDFDELPATSMAILARSTRVPGTRTVPRRPSNSTCAARGPARCCG